MPTVTGNGIFFDMTDIFRNSNFLESIGQSGSSTAFVTTYFNERWEFTGTSFGDFFGTIPTTGTINTFRWFSPTLAFTVTDLTLPIPILFAYMANNDLVGLHNFIFAGDDTINGGAAGENLLGYGGNDVINGGGGDDVITPGPGVDQVDGGAGNDFIFLDRSASSLSFTFDTGLMASSVGQTLVDGSSIRNIECYDIVTGSGNDSFIIASVPILIDAAPLSIDGGAGLDTLTFDFSSLNVSVTNYLVWRNIEALHMNAGSWDDTLIGGSGDDQINGGAGRDTLSGGAGGVDILDGGPDDDTVFVGFAGVTSDLFFSLTGFRTQQGVTFANGTIVRNAETVHITGGEGNDTFELGGDFVGISSSFSGGGGFDTVTGDFSASNRPITLDGNGVFSWQTYQNYAAYYNTVTTTAERYVITGGSANDELSWLGGPDQLDGGAGNDTLRYNAGWPYRPQSVIVDAGMFAGLSTASGATLSNGAVFRNFETLSIILSFRDDVVRLATGFTGVTNTNINGDDGFDTIEANFAGETRPVSLNLSVLSIGSGLVARFTSMERLDVVGGDSSDLIRGGAAADVINGGRGNDYIEGDRGADTLSGGDGDDIIYGSYQGQPNALPPADDGADTISGGAGDDILSGGAGADVLSGGAGTDVSLYSIASTSATWTRNADGGWTVNAGADGADTLTTVEVLSFSDRRVVLDNAQRTFSGNGTSDLLFRNSGHGTVVIWDVTGGVQNSALVAGGAPTEWTVIGTGDLNGDGKDDLIWRHDGGGVAGWLMNGASATSIAMVGGAPTEWQVAGLGDFNFDGKDDFVWRNTSTGAIAVWLMDGLTSTSQAIISGAPLEWRVAAIADFDGDGRDDILLRNDDGTLARWTTNGVVQTSASIVGGAPVEWQVAGAGDFDGDGRADILLHNSSSGAIALWRMDGSTQLSANIVGAAPTAWRVAQIGDFSGDGKDDILLRHTDGTMALWTMDGASVTNVSIFNGVPTEWELI